ncbi:MAG TPA: YbhB/YbcL family Raf kinase inhibitor-like protein [Longimicrobiaceae bacterium]|nr:YbhB/YbcL family Raf kinase inhibitor-like protein [Longimicrobiaceae bacterium]
MPRAGFTVSSADALGGAFTSRQESSTGGCNGQNLSPALAWRGAPAGTRGFAVTMFDPDAPTGSGFWHWIAYDIPATVHSLPSGAGGTAADGAAPGLPAGAVQAVTDLGAPAFAGACPPGGDAPHRYVITVHALDTDHVQVPPGATAAVVRFILHAHTIATASLTARYGRPAAATAGSRSLAGPRRP